METIKIKDWNALPKNYTGIVEYNDGTTCYYSNGLLHSEDYPAVMEDDGTLVYYLNGERHRDDGPAFIRNDRSEEYYINGLLHREDGPACINKNHESYYLNGKLHREDGPAIIYSDGDKVYYLNDKNISIKEVNNWIKKNNIPKVWNKSHKILFKLTFG